MFLFLVSRELFNFKDDIKHAFENAKGEIDGFFARKVTEEEISRAYEDVGELFNTEDEIINEAFEEVKDEIDGFFASFWGKKCVLDGQCMQPLAYCDKKVGVTGLDGQCRPKPWVWSVLAGIAILLVGSCVCGLLRGFCRQ